MGHRIGTPISAPSGAFCFPTLHTYQEQARALALTDKQQAFINEYLKCWNATEAARRAGYSERSIRSIASENLTKPDIADEIQRRIDEDAMSADEVLARLANQARGSFHDVLKLAGGIPLIDWERAFESGAIDNVKDITFKDGSITLKLYDAQSALVHLGKHLGLFKDQVQVETWQDKVIALLKEGKVSPDDVLEELGDDSLAAQLFNAAGIPATTSRET
jgi:phage terminase small subunit